MRMMMLVLSILLGLVAMAMFTASIWTSDTKWLGTGYLILIMCVAAAIVVSYLPNKESE